MIKKCDRVWLSWERHRRSIELAHVFGCELHSFEFEGRYRYLYCIIKTVALLIKKKPEIVFAQNPSMILAATVALYRLVYKKIIVIDRHTTFRIGKNFTFTPRNVIFLLLHKFTINVADITIVTNRFLADIVRKTGGRPFVLPDKIPNLIPLPSQNSITKKNEFNILMISSFGNDEPLELVLRAVQNFNSDQCKLYISGNYMKIDQKIIRSAPKNVVFTGYLSEQQYVNLLFEVNAAMALTTAEYCMLCGCYEAIAAEKPLITSNTKVLKDYFKGSAFVENNETSIAEGIRDVINNYDHYKTVSASLKNRILHHEHNRIALLEKHILRVFESL
jgi:glycosyltransferase involved in cell wall biosynthesis